MTQYRTVDGDSADLIAWRLLGGKAGTAEALLDANPGLAARGPVLPAGLLLTLPAAPERRTTEPVRLWD
jgi:phage tail protein X